MAVEITRFNKQTGKNETKVYETVAERVRKFREACPISEGWALVTDVSCPTEDIVLAVAKIISPSGQIVATGTAEEKRNSSLINKTSAVENAETSAIGRALMAAGFGGGEFCSAEELLQALKQQQEIEAVVEKNKTTPQKSQGKTAQPNQSKTSQPTQSSQPQSEDLLKYLPPIDGVEYVQENGQIVAKGKTYGKSNVLKAAGFKWNAQRKVWYREAA